MAFLEENALSMLPRASRGVNCCGCLCIPRSVKQGVIRTVLKRVVKPESWAYYESFPKRLLLINSFWGLDKAMAVPPNWIPTGPLFRPPADLLPILKEKNEELFNWMNEA